jgi:hypothetical protein
MFGLLCHDLMLMWCTFLGCWRPMLIQMDVGGLPPIPTSSFWQFFSLAVFFPSFRVHDLRGRFEALNNVLRARHSRK